MKTLLITIVFVSIASFSYSQGLEKINNEARFWIADSAYLLPSQAKEGFVRKDGLTGFIKKNDTTYITMYRMWPYTNHTTWEGYILDEFENGEQTVWGRLMIDGEVEISKSPVDVLDTMWITSSVNSLSDSLYFKGDWIKSQQPDRTIAFSNNEGDVITAYLDLDKASNLTIIGEYLNTHGKVKITIDGNSTIVNTYREEKTIPAHIFSIELQKGKHVLSMEVVEDGKYFVLIGIGVEEKQVQPDTEPKPTPIDTTIIKSVHNELHKALESALGIKITRKGRYEVSLSLPDSIITIHQPDLQIEK